MIDYLVSNLSPHSAVPLIIFFFGASFISGILLTDRTGFSRRLSVGLGVIFPISIILCLLFFTVGFIQSEETKPTIQLERENFASLSCEDQKQSIVSQIITNNESLLDWKKELHLFSCSVVSKEATTS